MAINTALCHQLFQFLLDAGSRLFFEDVLQGLIVEGQFAVQHFIQDPIGVPVQGIVAVAGSLGDSQCVQGTAEFTIYLIQCG